MIKFSFTSSNPAAKAVPKEEASEEEKESWKKESQGDSKVTKKQCKTLLIYEVYRYYKVAPATPAAEAPQEEVTLMMQ